MQADTTVHSPSKALFAKYLHQEVETTSGRIGRVTTAGSKPGSDVIELSVREHRTGETFATDSEHATLVPVRHQGHL